MTNRMIDTRDVRIVKLNNLRLRVWLASLCRLDDPVGNDDEMVTGFETPASATDACQRLT